MDKRCENCEYSQYDKIDQGYVCVNGDSEYCAYWVERDHCCEDWSGNDED